MKTGTLLWSLLTVFVNLSRLHGEDWSQFQRGETHNGRTSAQVNPSRLSLAWSVENYTNPRIVGENVFAVGFTGFGVLVSSFSLATGQLNWTYSDPSSVEPMMVVHNGLVIVLADNLSFNTLAVLDRETGALLYSVPLRDLPYGGAAMVVADDPTLKKTVAYCVDGGDIITAVALGPNSGKILWEQSHEAGSNPIPTIVEGSVIVAGGDEYYAFDRETGTPNNFHHTGTENSDSGTAVYDPTRRQFYIRAGYTGEQSMLSAYSYESNDSITLLWQTPEPSGFLGGTVALGSQGEIYDVNSKITQISPTTGAITRTISGPFLLGSTPATSSRVLWADTATETVAYDLTTFRRLGSFPGTSVGTGDGPGAFAPGTFVLGRFNGIDIYKDSP